MLDKYRIKKFIHGAIHLAWGLQGKLAAKYGNSEPWLSTLLNENNENDGFVYPYLLFMERLNELSPETFAMIDDEVRRHLDEMRARGIKGRINESVDTLVEGVGVAWLKFQTAYRNRVGRGELKALSAKISAQANNLTDALDPVVMMPDEFRKKA
jgi:hypothetical protein